LVHDGTGRYLLVEETKAEARGRMALPAGKLEPGEMLIDAAAREAEEETGLTVEIEGLIGVFHCPLNAEGAFGVNFVYAAVPTGGTITTTEEHPRIEWLDLAEVEALERQARIRGEHVARAMRFFEDDRWLAPDTVTVVGPTLDAE
jgi:ADP-ribose pyrophosphatase YjhB (NUDIX family)